MSLTGNAEGKVLRGTINKLTELRGYSAYEVALLNGFSGTEEEWLASLAVNPDAVEDTVREYLTENPVAVDATLSVKGMAAEAKTVGDGIARLDQEVASVGGDITRMSGEISGIQGHVASKDNPHETTAEQIGAATSVHEHAAGDITSGVLGIERGGTGAATAEEARAKLGAASATSNIVSTANTSLDDYTTDGWYFFSSSFTPTNIPTGTNGWLQVVSIGTFVKQIWYRAGTPNSNDYHTWLRTYSTNSGWGNWYQIDMIVEEGTSGIWNYRKYASGLAECWGQETVTVDITTDFGGWFRANITPSSYPFAFKALPVAHLDATSTNNKIFVLAKYGEATTTNIGAFAVLRPTSSTGAGIRIYYRAVGKWK